MLPNIMKAEKKPMEMLKLAELGDVTPRPGRSKWQSHRSVRSTSRSNGTYLSQHGGEEAGKYLKRNGGG